MDSDYDLKVVNRVEINGSPKSQHQKTGTFNNTKSEDPLMMSVGSNLLAMLNNRQSIQTNSDKVEGIKGSSQHSAQMRRCMKNFNFKLDYSEIDRIIEEQEDTPLVEEEMKQVVKAKSPEHRKSS